MYLKHNMKEGTIFVTHHTADEQTFFVNYHIPDRVYGHILLFSLFAAEYMYIK